MKSGKSQGENNGILRMEMTSREKFSDSLLPTDYDARSVKIWALKNHPDKLIRERIIQEGENVDALKKTFRESQELFGRMSTEYGVPIVSMSSKIDRNKQGQEAVFDDNTLTLNIQ